MADVKCRVRLAFYGNLDGRTNHSGKSRGIGPCLVDVDLVDDGVHTPNYYVYIDGSHQCGGVAAHFYPGSGVHTMWRLVPR